MLTLTSALGDVNVMDRVEGVGGLADVLARSEQMDLGDGVRCRVLWLEALIRAQPTTRRRSEQLPELEALLEVGRRSWS